MDMRITGISPFNDIFLKYQQHITIKMFHPRVDKGGVKRFEESDEEKLFPFSYQPIR